METKQRDQTLLERILHKPTFTADIYIRKNDKNLVPQVLLIKNQSIQHKTITSAHIYSMHVAGAYSTSLQQTITTTNKIGIKYHRKSTTKPVSHAMASLCTPRLAPRMYPLMTPSADQKSFLRSYSKNNKSTSNRLSIPHFLQDTAFDNRIFLSDLLDLKPIHFNKLYPLSSITTVTDENLLQPLHQNPNGTLSHQISRQPFLDSYDQHIRSSQQCEYLIKRDQYRQQVYNQQHRYNADPTYWSNSSSRMAGDIYSQIPK